MSELLHYENVTARLTSVTPISERHGKSARVSAQSLILEIILTNRVFDFFDTGLRHAFYRVPAEAPAKKQSQLDVSPADLEGLTEKRFPWFTQDISIERELAGYVFTIHFGLGGEKSDIELEAKKITDFKFALRDHGVVALKHRLIVHPKTVEKGRIEEMLQQEIRVSLAPPKPDGQGNLIDPAPAGTGKKGRGRPSTKVDDTPDPFAGSDLARKGK